MYYVFMTNFEIPNPAFWAITENEGAQLIIPGSELADTITDHLDSVPTHDGMNVGDIFIASEASSVISPEDMGIERTTIASYTVKPAESSVSGLRKWFKRKS